MRKVEATKKQMHFYRLHQLLGFLLVSDLLLIDNPKRVNSGGLKMQGKGIAKVRGLRYRSQDTEIRQCLSFGRV